MSTMPVNAILRGCLRSAVAPLGRFTRSGRPSDGIETSRALPDRTVGTCRPHHRIGGSVPLRGRTTASIALGRIMASLALLGGIVAVPGAAWAEPGGGGCLKVEPCPAPIGENAKVPEPGGPAPRTDAPGTVPRPEVPRPVAPAPGSGVPTPRAAPGSAPPEPAQRQRIRRPRVSALDTAGDAATRRPAAEPSAASQSGVGAGAGVVPGPDDRSTRLHRSLIYSGTLGLALSVVGAAIVIRRRRLW